MVAKGLTRASIIDAAIDIIDAEGLDALSMRALGRACGVKAMSLYRYIANKEELLDAVQEGIIAQMQLPKRRRAWLGLIEAAARELRRVLAEHPNAIPLFVRPAATTGAFVALEQVWRVLIAAGFDEADALRAVQSMLAFVVGQALWQFTPEGERQADDEFEFGLEVMLLGLQAKLS
ncbi:Transcriptional regulator, TetR family protein [Enhygromyxa salina]|uniref:Transcriptional regulator, TetR family protein n=1 Tax=Enhygromyxa salina TaxID=215803 RepID=A0A0C1Z7X3_9BACT|nr:TetR/AcrR family transcriptional regulator C-terminal domain-containing protein [Enhygromyxa salina]KIG13714.1 Transcriptional regulator, TetR family protein [Enhygromyxa salina]